MPSENIYETKWDSAGVNLKAPWGDVMGKNTSLYVRLADH